MKNIKVIYAMYWINIRCITKMIDQFFPVFMVISIKTILFNNIILKYNKYMLLSKCNQRDFYYIIYYIMKYTSRIDLNKYISF